MVEIKSVAKNYFFLIISQLLALLFGVLTVVFFPKFMDYENYGFWQLFLFYSGFAGFFHFGLIDGVYLRYGGKNFHKTNKEIVLGQFLMLFLMLLFIIFIMLVVIKIVYNPAENYRFVISGVIVFVLINNLSSYITSLLQSFNKIKLFSLLTTAINVLLLSSFGIIFFLKNYTFEKYVVFFNLCYFVGLVMCVLTLKDVFKSSFKKENFKIYWTEFKRNITAGSMLMFSNIAALLILGIGRFTIEQKWGIVEFGKVSFAIALMGFLILFIRQIGVVLFPVLKNRSDDFLGGLFSRMLGFFNIFLLGVLLFYPIIDFFVKNYIPKYSEVLQYLIIILPICIFEGKMQVIYGTFMKVLRWEKRLLLVNFGAMLFSALLCFIGYYIGSIKFIVFSIFISLAVRSFVLDYLLRKFYSVPNFYGEILLIFFSLFFIILFMNFDNITAFILYFSLYIIYTYYYRRDLLGLLKIVNQHLAK